MQSGPWHDTREKRTPSAASPSSDGVCMLGSPAQPIMSARCWSDMTSTMFGLVVVTCGFLPLERRRSHTGGPAGADLGTKRRAASRLGVNPGQIRTERTRTNDRMVFAAPVARR